MTNPTKGTPPLAGVLCNLEELQLAEAVQKSVAGVEVAPLYSLEELRAASERLTSQANWSELGFNIWRAEVLRTLAADFEIPIALLDDQDVVTVFKGTSIGPTTAVNVGTVGHVDCRFQARDPMPNGQNEFTQLLYSIVESARGRRYMAIYEPLVQVVPQQHYGPIIKGKRGKPRRW